MFRFKSTIAAALLLMGLTACGPFQAEVVETVKPNETAFLVPLEGDTGKQQALVSEKFLNDHKVATKRVTIPTRKRETGRMPGSFEWIPTMKLITVDRAPVSKDWTKGSDTGTSTANQALFVESSDSIGFGVGMVVTAMIEEEDAALFLYKYAGTPLSVVMDTNVRNYINGRLSREFSKYTLEAGRGKKNDIIDEVTKDTKENFLTYGITITSLGMAEGMSYENPAIQAKIDEFFTSQMKESIEDNLNRAQNKVNTRNIEIAEADRKSAMIFKDAADARTALVRLDIEKMKAQAALNMSEKWQGLLPANIMPADSPMLMSLGVGK